MYRCMAMYHTPTGYIYADSEGETEDEAIAKARERCQFGLVDIAWMSIYEERDQGADDGAEPSGDEPSAAGCDVLGPEPVAPGKHEKVGRHAHLIARDWQSMVDERASVGSEADLYLTCKRDEVKVLHLPKHRLLVYGNFHAQRPKPAGEVADLPRMPPNLEQIPGEVWRHGSHGQLHSVGVWLLGTILAAAIGAAVVALAAGALE